MAEDAGLAKPIEELPGELDPDDLRLSRAEQRLQVRAGASSSMTAMRDVTRV
jgi:hypothetical protein